MQTSNGAIISIVQRIRVLGMIIEANGVNGEAITKLMHKPNNTMRLLKRVTNKRGVLREEALVRLIHSFVICYIAYVAAFDNWYKGDKATINVLIRRVYKSTSTHLLLQLGLHITLNEIAEAHRTSHLEDSRARKRGAKSWIVSAYSTNINRGRKSPSQKRSEH